MSDSNHKEAADSAVVAAESSGGRRGRFWRAAFAADTGTGNEVDSKKVDLP